MHYFLPLVSRCFTLGWWSRAKNMMSEMLARTILEQRKEIPLVDWPGKRWSTVWMKLTLQNSNWRIKKLYESGGAFTEKNSAKRWARKRSGISVEELYGETIIDRGVSWERTYQRLNCHRNSNSKTTRLQKISGTKRWNALKRPRNAIQTKVELLQNIIEPLVGFLREKTAADREIKQQKLRAKQQEQESQQQMI